MVEAAWQFIAASEFAEDWKGGASEQTILWREEDIWLRCRPDRLSADRRIEWDYKTTGDASPQAFIRHIAAMQYHVQDAFYRRGVRALGGPDPAFIFLAQETSSPYDCAFYACDPMFRAIAEAKVEQATETWRKCMKTGEWPGYGPRTMWAEAPGWMRFQYESEVANG